MLFFQRSAVSCACPPAMTAYGGKNATYTFNSQKFSTARPVHEVELGYQTEPQVAT